METPAQLARLMIPGGLKMLNILRFASIILLVQASLYAKTTWYEINYGKSQISFLAKSRMINANGLFRKWVFNGKISGNLHVVGDLVIECASIDTDNERRDKHLMGADFFNCSKFPQHRYRIQKIIANDKNPLRATQFEIEGTLTLHGVTLPVPMKLMRGGTDDNLELYGTAIIDRGKFGIVYNSVLNPIENSVLMTVKIQLSRAEK
jgi:polyisoprenoid-binding protein YceI